MPSLVAVIGYTLLVVWVGIAGARRTKSFSDFMVAGGKVGAWMTAFSYGAAYFSAVLFIGFAGKVGWAFGLSGLWIAVGNSLVGVLLVWLLLGARVKEMATRLGVHTMPEFLEARYRSPFLKAYSAAATFLFLVPYSAAVFIGLVYLLKITFSIPYEHMLLFMGILTGLYLVLGGYKAMASLDVYFGIMMVVGVVVLVGSTLGKAGSLAQAIRSLGSVDPRLVGLVGPPGIVPLLSLVILTSVGPFAMPQLIQKFYGVRDRQAIRRGMIASTVFALIATGGAYLTGALTRLFITPQSHPGAWQAGPGGPRLVPEALMPELLRTVIHPNASAFILLLVLAASMSTLAALVLVSASTLAKDLYHGFLRRQASDAELTRAMRISSAWFILLSMVVAYLRPGIVVTIISISWGAIAAVMLGPFLWGLFTSWVTPWAATLSSVGSLAICLVLFFLWGERQAPQAACLGMATSLVLPPLLSLVRGRPGAAGPGSPASAGP